MNPFQIDKLADPKDFGGRTDELKRLKDLIINKANVMMYGDRRYGKTSLIKHCFHSLPTNVLPVYLDIYDITDKYDFARKLYEAVGKATPNSLRKQTGKLLDYISRLKGVSMSPSRSGESFALKPHFESKDFDQLLASAMELIEQYCKHSKCTHAVIAIDEFQQVADLKDIKIDAKLREISQSSEYVSFIFSGSRKSILRDLLSKPKQPWYQMTTPMSIKGIDVGILKKHCQKKLGGKFEAQAFEYIYNTFRGQTRLILSACARLYGNNIKSPKYTQCERIVKQMVEEHRDEFTEKFLLFAAGYKKALKAVAMSPEGGIYEQQNLDNLNTSKQSLLRSISALEKQDILQKVSEGHYQFHNILFGIWMISEQRNHV